MSKPLIEQYEERALCIAGEMLVAAASHGRFDIGRELGEAVGAAVRAAFEVIEGAPEETPFEVIENALNEIKASQTPAGRL